MLKNTIKNKYFQATILTLALHQTYTYSKRAFTNQFKMSIHGIRIHENGM
jgi:hypothetical protein